MKQGIIFDFSDTLYSVKLQELFPGVPDLLATLYLNYHLALVTHAGLGIVNAFGIDHFFNPLCCLVDKSPELFQKIAKQWAVEPLNVVVVGNRLDDELTYGHSVGMVTVWLSDQPDSQDHADHVITNIVELKQVMQTVENR